MSGVVDVLSIILVAVGAGVVGVQPTWRGVALGLGVQYVGVVVHLLATSGWLAGLATAVVAVGIEALLLLHDRGRPAPGGDDVSHDVESDAPPAGEPSSRSRVRSRAARSSSEGGEARRQWFDLSVIALAVVGAIELALSRPLLGNLGSDAIFNILTLTGLLYCVIRRPIRVAGGLLLLSSTGSVLLRAADAAMTSGETLLFAVAQLALLLAVLQWEGTSVPDEQLS